MRFVAAANDGAHEVKKFQAALSGTNFAIGLDWLHSEAAPQVQFIADVPIMLRHKCHSAVVLPALRAVDPVCAQGCASQFAFLVPIGVTILILKRLEVGDCLGHHDGFAVWKLFQLAECHDARLATNWQYRVDLV